MSVSYAYWLFVLKAHVYHRTKDFTAEQSRATAVVRRKRKVSTETGFQYGSAVIDDKELTAL